MLSNATTVIPESKAILTRVNDEAKAKDTQAREDKKMQEAILKLQQALSDPEWKPNAMARGFIRNWYQTRKEHGLDNADLDDYMNDYDNMDDSGKRDVLQKALGM